MNYRIPIDSYGFFQKIELSKNKKGTRFIPEFDKSLDAKDSIDRFIELVIFTHPGECKFAYDFGFSFWENEFKNVSVDSFNSTEYPRKSFEKSLKETINRYEQRLENVNVEILLSDIDTFLNNTRIKYLVSVKVQGFIKGVQPKPYSKMVIFSVGPLIKK